MTRNTLTPALAATSDPSDLLDERQAAEALNIAVRTMRNWRTLRKGPRWVRIGQRMVRYRRDDLLAFIEGGAA